MSSVVGHLYTAPNLRTNMKLLSHSYVSYAPTEQLSAAAAAIGVLALS